MMEIRRRPLSELKPPSDNRRTSSVSCVRCCRIFASIYLRERNKISLVSLLHNTRRRPSVCDLQRNLSMSFPAHNVARATFTENTDILLFSLKGSLVLESSTIESIRITVVLLHLRHVRYFIEFC